MINLDSEVPHPATSIRAGAEKHVRALIKQHMPCISQTDYDHMNNLDPRVPHPATSINQGRGGKAVSRATEQATN